jgi:hypothetical protein
LDAIKPELDAQTTKEDADYKDWVKDDPNREPLLIQKKRRKRK